jgi:hypothetical protein
MGGGLARGLVVWWDNGRQRYPREVAGHLRRLRFAPTASPPSVMPVPVTGIQLPRVRAVRGLSYRGEERSLSRRRRGALDSCDEHRNDGGE